MTERTSVIRHPILQAGGMLGAAFAAIALIFWILGIVLGHAPEPIGSRAELFTEGAKTTLLLTLSSGAIGLVIGVAGGIARLQQNRIARTVSRAFISVIRGTPLLVQILFVYYALPAILPILKFNEFAAAVVALALNIGAYNAEVIRAGILAVPKGQAEAAQTLGLSRFQAMQWVVLPQAFRIVIPPLVNNLVALLKDSALASSIGLLELSLAGNRISSETFRPVPVLTTVALIYLLLTTILSIVARFIERSMRK